MGPHASESWQQVLILCQFNLHLGIGSLGALGKDVEDEARAVERLDLDGFLDKGDLFGREVIIKDDEADVILLDIGHNFLEFSFAHIGGAVGAVTPLQESAYGSGSRRFGEKFEFV